MNDLIPIATTVIGSVSVPTCDARELHAFLDVRRDFSTWIKDRVAKFDFVEGVDYVVFTESGENPAGGRPTKQYALTLRMGKHIGMAENTPRGTLIRDYFLLCEQRAQHDALVAAWNIPRDYTGALRLAADLASQVEDQRATIAQQNGQITAAAPKVAFVDRFVDADGLYGLKNAGKALGQRPNKFIQQLKADGYLYHEGAKLVPYQRWVERGLFEVKAHQREEWAGLQTYITPKGLTYFAEKLQPKQAELPMESPAEVD